LDKWLGTSPWLLLVFMFFGMGGAIKMLYELAKNA
jgi:F0F1-type ATP synthase assembly protein I